MRNGGMPSQRRPVRLFARALDKVPKLAPDPVAAPVAKGVENVETPEAGVELNKGVEMANAEDDADKELNGDDSGEAVVPNKDKTGAEVVGVENREGDDVAIDGVEKSEDPLPLEADTAAGAMVVIDETGAAELFNGPVA